MFPVLDHRNGVPIYRQIVDAIRRQIITGELHPGQQLLSVRVLAEQLRVNPMTVSKAYGLLEQEQLLERRRGVGLFVSKLSRHQLDRDKKALLADTMQQAVDAAVQFGLTEREAAELFSESYRHNQTRTRRQK